jgi:7-carboxy-7-deazaguanine synthase
MGIKIFLETNGILYTNLAKIIDVTDIISMDIKLPSATKLKTFWTEHQAFLEIAAETEVFVKTVVTEDTSDDEIAKVCSIISGVSPHIPLIIQPVTPTKDGKTPGTQRLLTIKDYCATYIENVRIIPQMHKFMGIL